MTIVRIEDSAYNLVTVREHDAIVFNRLDGRSYVCPSGTSTDGKRYVVIKNQIYYI